MTIIHSSEMMVNLAFVSILLMICVAVQSFRMQPFSLKTRFSADLRLTAAITEGVEFDTIAREWRLKWSGDNNKESLALVQKKLNDLKSNIQSVPGLKNIQRIVCGGCLDYKVVVSLSADKFGQWESNQFKPEAEFLAAVKSIPGVSTVETQTYTIMPV